jgi:predicted MPP superfamily phosphohydrolase
MSLFLAIFSLLHGLIFAYVGMRMIPEGGVGPLPPVALWMVLGVPYLMVWLVPLVLWRRRRAEGGPATHAFQIAAYISLGLCSFFLVFTVARDLLRGLLSFVPAALDVANWLGGPGGAATVLSASVACFLVGMVVAMRGPRVLHVDVALPDLAPGLHGLRIAQISDLHIGSLIGERYIDQVVEKTNALGADVVALTGDIVDGAPAVLGHLVDRLGALKGNVFYVPGNHEYYWNARAWLDRFAKIGFTVLGNASHVLEKAGARLHIGGILDPAAARVGDPARPDVKAAARGGDGAALRLLLAHQPGIAPDAAAAGFDLQLSGHTHAGQFFPWTFVIRFFHAHYGGLSREGKMWVYVNPGTGSWGPPVRLGSQPEITLLRLVQA